MSKSFINSIFQEGGELTKSEKVKALDEISKAINKKMKIIEHNLPIKLKLNKLPESNNDCIPKKIGIQSFAQISGPFNGQIPFYTTAEMPTYSPAIVGMGVGLGFPLNQYGQYGQLSPFGPFVGVQGLAINPFGTTADKLDERLKKAKETLTTIINIRNEFTKLKDKYPPPDAKGEAKDAEGEAKDAEGEAKDAKGDDKDAWFEYVKKNFNPDLKKKFDWVDMGDDKTDDDLLKNIDDILTTD